MAIIDLHEEFLKILHSKTSKKDIVNQVADMLIIEKDAAYRRLSGKVNFTVREIGIISKKLDFSLDRLIYSEDNQIWLPFTLAHPMLMKSMEFLFNEINLSIQRIGDIVKEPAETGNIYSSTLPLEFYLHSPVLTKFMFFKWGHYFIGTEEFNDYSGWEIPEKINGLLEKVKSICRFDKAYYILDGSAIYTLTKELSSFHKMHVITDKDKNEIKEALKNMLTELEQTLHGTHIPTISISPDSDFYVSPINLGFTSSYFTSENGHFINFITNFSYCLLNDSPESFLPLKSWIDSFRSISTLLSRSGRVERRLFFEEQYKALDYMLM